MAAGRPHARQHSTLPCRQRCTDSKRHSIAACKSLLGPHPRRDSRQRALLRRGDRTERAPLAHPQQRPCLHDKENAHVRTRIQGQERVKKLQTDYMTFSAYNRTNKIFLKFIAHIVNFTTMPRHYDIIFAIKKQ